MADIVTNVFVFIGVYYFIAIIWRVIEVTKIGRIEVKTEHTIICWILSIIIMIALHLWRTW